MGRLPRTGSRRAEAACALIAATRSRFPAAPRACARWLTAIGMPGRTCQQLWAPSRRPALADRQHRRSAGGSRSAGQIPRQPGRWSTSIAGPCLCGRVALGRMPSDDGRIRRIAAGCPAPAQTLLRRRHRPRLRACPIRSFAPQQDLDARLFATTSDDYGTPLAALPDGSIR